MCVNKLIFSLQNIKGSTIKQQKTWSKCKVENMTQTLGITSYFLSVVPRYLRPHQPLTVILPFG